MRVSRARDGPEHGAVQQVTNERRHGGHRPADGAAEQAGSHLGITIACATNHSPVPHSAPRITGVPGSVGSTMNA